MKKIALFTLQDNTNYGNRLQNYALHKTMTDMGYAVDSIVYHQSLLQTDPIYQLKIHVKGFLSKLGKTAYLRECSKARRTIACQKFSQKKTNRVFVDPSAWDDVAVSQYDWAIAGSDQVWHRWGLRSFQDELSYFYLKAFPREKRLSYAPSFGFSSFPEEDAAAHREGLMGIRSLSCREAEGCRLIQQLTGREAVQVLDPVLLLCPEEWAKMEKRPPYSVKKPYLLKFFLGEQPASYQEELRRIQSGQALHIIDLNDDSKPNWYGSSPAEYVWLIHHAAVVCTDSFHTAAFSILFSRDLRVFPRVQAGHNDMFGRLRTLLEPLGLMGLVFDNERLTSLSTALSPEASEYLARERGISLDFLRDSLTEKT